MLTGDRCKFNVSKVDRINGNHNLISSLIRRMPWILVAGWLAVPALYFFFPVVSTGQGVSITDSLIQLLDGSARLSPSPALMLLVVCLVTGYWLQERFPSNPAASQKVQPSVSGEYGLLIGIVFVAAALTRIMQEP